MQIVLPTEIKSVVERRVGSGCYADEQQVIVEALRRLAGEAATMTITEAVAESLAQIERGEVRELTDDGFDELLRQSDRQRTDTAFGGGSLVPRDDNLRWSRD